MTWQIIYYAAAAFCLRHAYIFYKTHNGNLRKAWMYFFLTLAFNFIVRAIGEDFLLQTSLLGYIAITPVIFSMVYLHLTIQRYRYGHNQKDSRITNGKKEEK